jgi:hypothetical protein
MSRPKDRLTDPRSIALFWAGYIVLSLNQSYVWAVVANRERSLWEPVPFALATAIVWGCLTPFIVRLARARRIDRATWRRNIPWHVGGILLAGLCDAAADQLARAAAGLPFAYWPDYFRKLDIITFYYAIIAGITHAVDYYRMYRTGELRAAQLESELRQSQLEILKSQLQPHFLFNTLNAVNALIYEDPRAADRVVTRLGELLRMSLAVGNRQEVTLAYELEFVKAYLDIQVTRLGDRLKVVMDVPDELHDALVPALLLQPLVENAVLHGIAPRARGGMVIVRARADGDRLAIEVVDDGAGFRGAAGHGIGLANVQQRLRHIHGDAQSFRLSGGVGGGVRVEIGLPLRREPGLLPEEVVALPA